MSNPEIDRSSSMQYEMHPHHVSLSKTKLHVESQTIPIGLSDHFASAMKPSEPSVKTEEKLIS